MIFENENGLPVGLSVYKGNLHSHTTNSDGHLNPKESAEMFRAHGYSFLCLSEHDLFTDYREELNTDSFIILPGIEASCYLFGNTGAKRPMKCHHMNGILGTEAMQKEAPLHFSHKEKLPPTVRIEDWNGEAEGQALIDTLYRHGCLVTYNHPIWSRVEPQEIRDLDGIWALEIYNYDTVNESATGADTTYWDMILRSGKQLFAVASDDNHNPGTFDDACGGWIMVFAKALTYEYILQAMIRGDYYSSSGPEIYGWGVKDDVVWVECSACERINFICGGLVGAGETKIAPSRDGLRCSTMLLSGTETYVRVECVDYNGKKAWTNAIFLKPVMQ